MIRGNLARIFRATVHPRNKNLLSTASQAMMSVQQSITEKLTKEFKPVYLDVMNESYMHNVPKGSETHFKVVVVSSNFNDTPLIQRHRLVNEVLKEELATGVHALSIQVINLTPKFLEAIYM
ncbi:uncharacterized protein LOC113669793 [Pocillopora damicornis]|uniref:uncharacterized protein LOC113669793 n=1 Tax=Pocillopora damicornis TaxID=46731 RepID=UPI000F5582D2|nr:uncharacterized protein LOC113669793 [Pocillopora damicornis]